MIWPDFKDWRTWTAVIAAIGTISAVTASLAPRAEAFFYVSSEYLRDTMSPLLAASYENKIEIIEGKQATYQMLIDNADARLRATPDDPVIRAARTSALKLYDDAEFQKQEAYCQLRAAKGIGCTR